MRQNNRPIEAIAEQLQVVMKREASDFIAIGDLLIEAKEHLLDHGGWLPWLETNFGSSVTTAENYMSAARLAEQILNVKNLKLRPTALYLLGRHLDDGPDARFSPKAIEAILKVAEHEWVNDKRAYAIAQSLLPPPEIEEDSDEGDSDEEEEAIDDGPLPESPPPPPPYPPRGEGQFDKAVEMLVQVHTKPLANFAGTKHSWDMIRNIRDFLNALLDANAKKEAA